MIKELLALVSVQTESDSVFRLNSFIVRQIITSIKCYL